MMELNLQRQTVTVNEAVYSGAVEQPLECDVLLPDYCPDIQKILRCEVSPSLLSAPVSGEKLTVDGMAVVHLYYLSEDGCLRHAEYKIPYTKTIELRSSPASPSVHVTQSIDYFNCRAVSPRRLDMRGAVSIQARVSSLCEEQIVCGADGAGMQFCSDRAENTVLLPQSARQLSVREELELGYGKPAIGNIIRYTASADVSDYKVISGKVVTKGELSVRIIYQCEEDPKQLELMEYAIPVSQVVDVEGVDEECVCNVWYDVCGLDVSPKRNGDGENRVFALEAAVNACVCAHRRVELDTCCDCYSTLYECKQSQKQLPFLKLLDVVSETCTSKESIDLPPTAFGTSSTSGVPQARQLSALSQTVRLSPAGSPSACSPVTRKARQPITNRSANSPIRSRSMDRSKPWYLRPLCGRIPQHSPCQGMKRSRCAVGSKYAAAFTASTGKTCSVM